MYRFLNYDGLVPMDSYAQMDVPPLIRELSKTSIKNDISKKSTALSKRASVDSRANIHFHGQNLAAVKVQGKPQTLNKTLSESLTLTGRVSNLTGNSSNRLENINKADSTRLKSKISKYDAEPSFIAYQMIENNVLDVKKLDTRRMSKGEIEMFKLFISNIVYIKSKARVKVDYKATMNDFVAQVNESLGQPEVKRPDDRLRWVYKRFINQMLMEKTEYRPTKNHQKETYLGVLVQEYFSKNPNTQIYKFGLEVLSNSTFLSKKRLKEMFAKSESFKLAFKNYVSTFLLKDCQREFQNDYQRMYLQLEAVLIENPNKQNKLDSILHETSKRLPWRSVDVQNTIQQVNDTK